MPVEVRKGVKLQWRLGQEDCASAKEHVPYLNVGDEGRRGGEGGRGGEGERGGGSRKEGEIYRERRER